MSMNIFLRRLDVMDVTGENVSNVVVYSREMMYVGGNTGDEGELVGDPG